MDALNKKVWQLAWPLLLSNLSAPLLGLVDTAVVGHLSSARYLASVALASNYFMLLYFSFNFLRMSTTGLAAQASGAKQSGLLLLSRALLLAVSLGLLLIVLNPVLRDFGLSLLGGSADIQRLAGDYINTRIWGAPAALANYVLMGFAVGMGQTRIALKTTLIMHSVNALLSYGLVYYFYLDVKGVAAASAIADYAGCFAALFYLRSHFYRAALRQLSWPALLHWPALKSLVSLNRDLFIRSALLLSVFFFFTAQGARFGERILAANAVLIGFLLLLSSILDGFANAAEALVGKACGENNRQQEQAAIRATGLWTVFVAFLCLIGFALFAPYLIAVLTSLDAVRQTALEFLPWVLLLPISASAGFWLDGVFVGSMRAKAMRNTMLLAVIVFFVVWFFSQNLANHGLWLAMNCLMATRGLLMGAMIMAKR